MSDEQLRRSLSNDEAAPLPGPAPAVPDLDAVSASIERARVASAAAPPAIDARENVTSPAPPETPLDDAATSQDVTERAPGEGEWAPVAPRAHRPIVGPWALALAIVALGASFVVGWMLPLGLAAVVVAIVALRRPVERRSIAVWALVLAAVSVLYSAGWLLWAAWRLGLLG